MITKRGWPVGLLMVVCASCSGFGALGDKVWTPVVDGQLVVRSCWEQDRLIEVRIVRSDGSAWSATEHSGSGLPLQNIVTMEQVAASGQYDMSGERPDELLAGDHIYFTTAEESRNYVLTTEMLSDDEPPSC